jgi:ribosomal protein S18 acetylase RimI-like enzyme
MMKLPITIRQAVQDDIDIIAEFNIAMARETEQKTLTPTVIHHGVEYLFKHPEYGFYIVAESDKKVVGCLMITYEWSDWRNALFWWIQSVYILPDYRRQGIYRRMYQYVKNAARNQNICGFRLYVEKNNRAAQQTYKNLGMQETFYKLYEEINN